MPITITSAMITKGIIIAIAIAIVLILASGYVKASPDTAMIISGLRKNPKVLIGKAGIKIPFLERKDELNLQLIPIDVKTSNAVPTADYININVDATVNVKISDNEERLKLAAQNFLNKNAEYIGRVAREVLEGNVREIVGKMQLEEMVSDRQKFATLVKENAEPDLAAMGLDIISFNVQNFVDGNGVIENLGVDNIVKIQKNAAISRAESEKEIAKAQAKAAQESNDAEVESNRAIAERQNELDIKRSQLKMEADRQRADADVAYKIQEQEQRKVLEIKTVDANIAKQQQEILLRRAEAEAKEEELNASVRKRADADLYQREKAAAANLIEKQREAEAKRYEMEQEAEALKIKAEADKYAKEQEAAGKAAIGRAEAEAIQAKGIAEAEAMNKKADAMAKYGQAAITEMVVKTMPDIAKSIASAVGSINNLTVIDSGNGAAVGAVGDYTPQMMRKTIDTVKAATGFDILQAMNAETYDAKVNRNVNLTSEQGGMNLGIPAVNTHGQREMKNFQKSGQTVEQPWCEQGCTSHECLEGKPCPYESEESEAQQSGGRLCEEKCEYPICTQDGVCPYGKVPNAFSENAMNKPK